MRAVMAPHRGGTWMVCDCADPSPGPQDVMIRVEASGVCYTDIHHLHNPVYRATFPRIPGHEPVGTVVAIGKDVRHVSIGDRVGVASPQRWCGVCKFCLTGRHEVCHGVQLTGATIDGGHAELAVIDAAAVEQLPKGLPFNEAAPIFCAGYTVYSGLRDADVRPGERVAIVGLGGLGHLALQYACALGAEVIALTHTASKAKWLHELGAHEVLVASGAEVGKALQRSGGVDVLLMCGTTIEQSALAGVRPYGRVSLCGVTEQPLSLTPRDLIFRKVAIYGSSQGPRSRLREVLDLHVTSRVRTIVEEYPLEQALQAYGRVEAGQVRFRAVLLPSS